MYTTSCNFICLSLPLQYVSICGIHSGQSMNGYIISVVNEYNVQFFWWGPLGYRLGYCMPNSKFTTLCMIYNNMRENSCVNRNYPDLSPKQLHKTHSKCVQIETLLIRKSFPSNDNSENIMCCICIRDTLYPMNYI